MSFPQKQPLLLISEHFAPSHGATAQLMTDLATGLAARGQPVVVLTATATAANGESDPPTGAGLRVVRLGLAPGETPRLLLKAWRGLRFFGLALAWGCWHGRRGQRLLIASNPPFIGLLGPLLQLRGLTYVFLLQDLFPRSAVLSGLLPARSPVTSGWSALMSWVCGRSRCTVVLSEAMAEALQQDCGPGLPLQVIHNWAVERALPGDRVHNPFARELGVDQLFTVQYSGNFGRLHDLHTLLQAAQLLRHGPLRFLFIGGGAKEAELRAFVHQHQLNNVIQLPYQPRAQLPITLGACDISAIALRPGVEATVAPCKFYGILASARPVLLVANPRCDLAQLLQIEQCGLVVAPGEAGALAEQLSALQEDPERVAAMGQRARQLYEQRFGLERSLQAYEALLR